MNLFETLGWIAFALNVWGNLALTTKGVRGWLIRLASNALWLIYSAEVGAWALFWNHLTFAGINVYGWWKWSAEARRARVV